MKLVSQRERGVALFISLILLLMITLFAVTSFRLGAGNLLTVGNMQQRNQALSAAQLAIEQVVSSTRFTSTPTDAIPSAQTCNGNSPNTMCQAANGGTVKDLTTVVSPACVYIKPIAATALDLAKANDAGCSLGTAQTLGIEGSAGNDSLCADALWDIRAVATDNVTATKYKANQGVTVRIPSTETCP